MKPFHRHKYVDVDTYKFTLKQRCSICGRTRLLIMGDKPKPPKRRKKGGWGW